MQSVANDRLKLIGLEEKDEPERNHLLMRCNENAESISEIIGEMEKLIEKLRLIAERLPATQKLVEKDEEMSRRLSESARISRLLMEMMGKEVEGKRASLYDASWSNDRNLLMACVATWTHQPFLCSHLFDELYAFAF